MFDLKWLNCHEKAQNIPTEGAAGIYLISSRGCTIRRG